MIFHFVISTLLSLKEVGAVEDFFPQVELDGPRHFVALADDLKVDYRFSNRNGSEEKVGESPYLPSCLFFRLTLAEGEGEVGVAAERVPTQSILDGQWHQVSFQCGLIVKGGDYSVHLLHGEESENCTLEEENGLWGEGFKNTEVGNVRVKVSYPAIDFEVPTRLETYSASVPISFGLTRTLCKPRVPFPPTELRLSVCQPPSDQCSRDFATVFQQPLQALQKDGRVTITVGCELWARNYTYRLQIVEKSPRVIIARSQPIKVEWSSRFSLNVSKASILPCRGSLRVTVANPNCLLGGRDKIRIQGYETSMVPTLVNSGHPFYIGEQLVQPHLKFVNIKCNIFPQRFSRVCFQYINTAIDMSVAIVLEHCVHMHPLHTISDGGWGPWSVWSSCSSTCGYKGKQYRFRFCDSPPPTTSSSFCKGNAIEESGCGNVANCSVINKSSWTEREKNVNTESTLLHYEHEDGEDREGEEEYEEDYEAPTSREEFDGGDAEEVWTSHGHVNFSFEGTQGCECGCHLRDLTPGVNNSLTVYIPINDSSCSSNNSSQTWNSSLESDSSAAPPERLTWVLHARDLDRRIRVVFMDWSTQCIWLAVRDGETSDSNLLKVISGERSGRRSGVVVQSNGPSITITPTHLSPSHSNCSSAQFIFFVVYAYDFLPLDNDPGHSLISDAKKKGGGGGDLSVETLLLLLLKLILVILSVALLCSAVGVLATRGNQRRRSNRKILSRTEKSCPGGGDEGAEPTDGLMGGVDESSRATSVTLMSFDYALWKECRLMKLKYFLLRPRRAALRTKSVPNTPMTSELQIALRDTKSKKMVKSPSYPENDLLKARRRRQMKHLPLPGGVEEKKSRECGTLSKKKSSSEFKNSSQQEKKKIEKELSGKVPCTSEHIKFQKESFNLKRKANERQKEKDGQLSPRQEEENNKQHHLTDLDNNRATDSKSQLSFASSSLTDFTRSSSHRTGGGGMDLGESLQDFEMEMDYYDYDVTNASNIPGSYLALEPTFVLWNSELDPDTDPDQDSLHFEMPAQLSPTIIDCSLSEKKSETEASTSKD